MAFDLPSGWRGGIEAAQNGNQYQRDGSKAPDWWFWAASIMTRFTWGSLTLNGENLFDYRQSREEAIVSGPITSPDFEDLWAPIDGRVINFSLKYDW